MAKRNLPKDENGNTLDWNGDEGIYAARAVEQYDEKALLNAQRPRGLRFALWHHRQPK
jgi:hypothetical protein